MSSTKPASTPSSRRASAIFGALASCAYALRPRRPRLFLGMALLISVSGCQLVDIARFTYANAHATLQWANGQHTTTIPFTLVDNHIVLPVRVNGSEPLNFVLDSGAGATVIMESHGTRALQLKMNGELPVSGVGSGPNPVAHIVRDVDLSLGDVSLEGQSVIYLPLDSIPFFDDLDQVYFDGVIGAPFFTRFVVEIDHDRRLISLTEPAVAEQRIARLGDGWREVSLQIESGLPYMTAQVDPGQGQSIAVKMLVDTGFRDAVSLTPATHDGLREPRAYFQTVNKGLSGDVVSRVAIAESLTLAGYPIHRLPVNFDIAGGESADGSNGILGNELLQHFNLVFDYANKRLFVAPNQNFSAPISADRSGLQIRPHTAGGIVRHIATGSAGQAIPLQAGDIITAFDDTPVTYQSIRELKRALASERDSVRLCWLSGAMQRCEDLRLASRFSNHDPASL